MRATCADQLELGGVEVGIRCYVLTTLRLSDLKRLASHSVWLQYLSTYWWGRRPDHAFSLNASHATGAKVTTPSNTVQNCLPS